MSLRTQTETQTYITRLTENYFAFLRHSGYKGDIMSSDLLWVVIWIFRTIVQEIFQGDGTNFLIRGSSQLEEIDQRR